MEHAAFRFGSRRATKMADSTVHLHDGHLLAEADAVAALEDRVLVGALRREGPSLAP